MPGASLWLIPPDNHPLTPHLQTLITDTLPPLLPGNSPSFPPHLTLTSGVPLRLLQLDPDFLTKFPIPFSAINPHVRFTSLVPGRKFFMKETLYCWKDPPLLTLSTILRYEFADHGKDANVHKLIAKLEGEQDAEGANDKHKQKEADGEKLSEADAHAKHVDGIFEFINDWTEEYTPHVSLVYNDISYELLVGGDSWDVVRDNRDARKALRMMDKMTRRQARREERGQANGREGETDDDDDEEEEEEGEQEEETLHDRIGKRVDEAGIKFINSTTTAPPQYAEEGLIASFRQLEQSSSKGSADYERARQLRKEYEAVLEAKKAEFEELERWAGWRGGKIVLVDCEGPVEGWRVLAERKLNNDGVDEEERRRFERMGEKDAEAEKMSGVGAFGGMGGMRGGLEGGETLEELEESLKGLADYKKRLEQLQLEEDELGDNMF